MSPADLQDSGECLEILGLILLAELFLIVCVCAPCLAAVKMPPCEPCYNTGTSPAKCFCVRVNRRAQQAVGGSVGGTQSGSVCFVFFPEFRIFPLFKQCQKSQHAKLKEQM